MDQPFHRGVFAPIPFRPNWPCSNFLCGNLLAWPAVPWFLPSSAWPVSPELRRSSPSNSISTISPYPSSIFPSPAPAPAPFPCPCCPPLPPLKPYSSPTSIYQAAFSCTVSSANVNTVTSKPPYQSKQFRCTQCFKCYNTSAAFHTHLRTHVQGCQCPICGKSFSRHWLLQGHIRTHTGEKPFSCPRCGKAFADKSNLRAHVQTHSGLKPFACGRCGKRFALKSYLSKHEESACVKQLE